MMMLMIMALVLLTANHIDQTEATSCQYGGRGACVASCMAQNCATGYCTNGDQPNSICRCSRCGTGPPIPK